MNTFFAVLVLASLSTAAVADDTQKSDATSKQSDKAPVMVSFADLKWTELPERKGMLFAELVSEAN